MLWIVVLAAIAFGFAVEANAEVISFSSIQIQQFGLTALDQSGQPVALGFRSNPSLGGEVTAFLQGAGGSAGSGPSQACFGSGCPPENTFSGPQSAGLFARADTMFLNPDSLQGGANFLGGFGTAAVGEVRIDRAPGNFGFGNGTTVLDTNVTLSAPAQIVFDFLAYPKIELSSTPGDPRALSGFANTFVQVLFVPGPVLIDTFAGLIGTQVVSSPRGPKTWHPSRSPKARLLHREALLIRASSESSELTLPSYQPAYTHLIWRSLPGQTLQRFLGPRQHGYSSVRFSSQS